MSLVFSRNFMKFLPRFKWLSSRSLKMSDDLSLLMMQLPQKSRLVHSDGRRGEIKFLWELGNPKNENHWKLICPRHLPSHVDLHYLARAPSTFDKNSFHRRAAKGCNNFSDWMRSDSPSFKLDNTPIYRQGCVFYTVLKRLSKKYLARVLHLETYYPLQNSDLSMAVPTIPNHSFFPSTTNSCS